MIPVNMQDFINVMSLIIFGGIVLAVLLTVVAYALAINRRKIPPKKKTDPQGTSQHGSDPDSPMEILRRPK